MSDKTTTGTTLWWDTYKGEGRIVLDDGMEVYVNLSDLQGSGYKSLQQGQSVNLEVDYDPPRRRSVLMEIRQGSSPPIRLRSAMARKTAKQKRRNRIKRLARLLKIPQSLVGSP